MHSIVLDTNVLVSSVLKPTGDYANALLFILKHLNFFEIVVSPPVCDEYKDVLLRLFISERGLCDVALGVLKLIEDVSTNVIPKPLDHLVYPDVGDKPFVELAAYTNAIVLTNNVQDFPFLDLKVLRAQEFLELFDR